MNHVPEEKGRPRRSGEASKKAESGHGGVATVGRPENRDGGFTLENISDKLLRYIEAQ